jgi:hypothetical protein
VTNELGLFSAAELESALSIAMGASEAHELAVMLQANSSADPVTHPLQLSDDLLELLLLVSDSCASRVGSILGL